MNNKNDKNEKDLEELKKILKNDDNKKIGLLLGFYLHENFSIHILLTIVINLISGGVIIGLSNISYKIIEVNSYIAFFIAFLFYSLLEISIKTLLIRFIWKIIIQSLGLIFFVINIVFFFIVSLLVDNFSFFNNLSNILIFTIIFMIFRILLTTVIKRINIPLGGKKNE